MQGKIEKYFMSNFSMFSDKSFMVNICSLHEDSNIGFMFFFTYITCEVFLLINENLTRINEFVWRLSVQLRAVEYYD